MSDTTVRLKIKIEGSDSLKNVEMSADELAKAFVEVKDKVRELNEKLLNANQIAQAFEQVGAAVQGLQSVMHGLTEAYAVQSAAEARLEQMMRNTMGATEAEIQSIKDLAAEQQKLGVVGDEVILSGAQELATYMQKKESLEALIPVMGDMIAQQYGYNASTESAVSVAQMLGKVFAGETGALKRLGYTFDEAQEAVLKYGTEEEKVAMLTEVVGQIVDGTNAKLASMPYGKIVQFRNGIGDLKEELGKMVAPAMNAVDGIAKVSIAAAGIGKGVATVKAAAAAFKAMTAGLRTATAAQHGLNTAMKANVFIAVASAVATLVAVVVRLSRESRQAGTASEELAEATEAVKGAVGQTKAELDAAVSNLDRLMKQGKDTTKAVQELNDKYGESFGYYSTAAEWYDTLTKKSKIYCEQVRYEAKAKALSAKIVDLEMENDEKKRRRKEIESRPFTKAEAREFKELGKEIDENKEKIEVLKAEQEKAFNNANRISSELENSLKGNDEKINWQVMSYADLGKAINDQKKKVEGLIGVDDVAAKAEKATLDAMTARYNALARAYGLANNQARPATQNAQDVAARIPVEIIPNLKPIEPNLLQPIIQTLGMYDRQLQQLQQQRLNASREQLPAIDAEIARVKRLRDEFEGVTEEVQELAATPMPKFSDAWGSIKGIGNSIRDITNALTESEDVWTTITGLIDGFIGLFQSFEQVVEIINAVSAATETMAATKTAASSQVAAANSLEATTNTAVAATGAASAMANIPWVGPALAIAAVAAVLASLMSLPKFASGGLVYGPTLGLMGEYGGASSNPEVIAPLSRLRSILGADQGGSTEVKFRIEGRELVGIMNKQANIYQRNR